MQTGAPAMLDKHLFYHSYSGEPMPNAFAVRGDDFYLIAYTNEDALPLQSDVIRILQHELGHLVSPAGNAYDSTHSPVFRECVADAFSLLRSLQKPVPNESWANIRVWKHAKQLALDGTSCLTMSVLNMIPALQRTYDLATLTPVETANCAYRISLKYAPESEDLKHWEAIFQHVTDVYNDNIANLEPALEKCAELMFKDSGAMSSEIFLIGKTILEPFINHQMGILSIEYSPEDISHINFNTPLWNEVREKIKNYPVTPIDPVQQRLDHMQVMGLFDLPIEGIIDPKQYETAETQADIKEKRQVYEQTQHAQKPRPTSPKA